jgi:formate-dependent nitrite reductase cytochrome c552 subunit
MRHKALLAISLLVLLIFAGVGCERKIVNEDAGESQASLNSCFTCHGEDGYILAAQGEWENSVHASGTSVDYTNRGEGSDCTRCHDHQGFVDFIETGEINAPYDNVSAIHCFTCHAPHTRGNLSLRTDESYELETGITFDVGSANLCANCHHARGAVNDMVTADAQVYNRWGPHHGPQGDLLIASNGYEYDGLDYDYENTGHGANDDGCIMCHMGNPLVHNGYKIGGHSFNMVNPGDEEETLVGVCQECHLSADDFDYENIQSDVEDMLADLHDLLVAAGHLNAGTGLPSGTSTNKHTIADEGEAGALWNYLMVEEDRSEGVHNPSYIRDLLESSIEYMENRVPAGTNGLASTLNPIPAH